MCTLPIMAAKVCTLVAIPVTSIFCITEMAITIVSLIEDFPPTNLLRLILLVSLLYMIGLSAGFYGSIAQKVIFLQMMLFFIVAYLLVKVFIWVTTMNNIKAEENITHFWFQSSFMASVLCFLFSFVYTLRLMKIQNYDF